MTQNRIFWAVQAVGFAPLGATTYVAAKGVQSVASTTTFNLTPVFQYGQSRTYQNLEDIPDVELSMEKVLDGYPLLYHLATKNAPSATLFGRANTQCTVALSVFDDTSDSASGRPLMTTTFSGLYVSSVGYTFPADGRFSENVTLVGFNKVTSDSSIFSGGFLNTDTPLALQLGSGGIQQRQHFLFDFAGITTVDSNGMVNSTPALACTILPPDVAGISASGTNDIVAGTSNYKCSVQNISVSVNLNRESVPELGHRTPYCRYMNVPVDVTTQIDIISKSGDRLSATEAGIYAGGSNTRLSTIKLATREGTFIDLGTQNRLQSATESGGDTGGGNKTITYNFLTQNDFSVYHDFDVTSALAQ